MNIVMGFNATHSDEMIELSELEVIEEDVLLEFGTPWCGHCKRAQKVLEPVMNDFTDVAHVKVLDGKGKRLGRQFQVKLWPTLILVRRGKEVARVIRPETERELRQLLIDQFGKDTPGFDPKVLKIYDTIVDDAKSQIEALSNITEVNEDNITDSVRPK